MKILDIGCGNNSAYHVKNFIPNSHYTGIDIENHNNDLPNIADKIIMTSPKNFANSISGAITKHYIKKHPELENTIFE